LKKRIIGILGGMGPEATADLFSRIIRETPAKKDQDHIRIIIDNNPKIPDRTAAILGVGISPLEEMASTVKNLERAGAEFIIIPCVTAHYYYKELKKRANIPILNMVELTAKAIKQNFPNTKKAGLLGSTGTVKGKIFDQPLNKIGIKVVYPPANLQDRVMKAIYDCMKAGKIQKGRTIVIDVAKRLVEMESEVIICGCTEVSLVLKSGDLTKPVIDPLQILANHAVMIALGQLPYPKKA
jgi:aspartate racemase